MAKACHYSPKGDCVLVNREAFSEYLNEKGLFSGLRKKKRILVGGRTMPWVQGPSMKGTSTRRGSEHNVSKGVGSVNVLVSVVREVLTGESSIDFTSVTKGGEDTLHWGASVC